MARRRFKLKSAKIWLLLLIFALVYRGARELGIGQQGNVSDELNLLSESVLPLALWSVPVLLVIIVLSKTRRRRRPVADE